MSAGGRGERGDADNFDVLGLRGLHSAHFVCCSGPFSVCMAPVYATSFLEAHAYDLACIVSEEVPPGRDP